MNEPPPQEPWMEFHSEPRIFYCEPGWSWSPAPLQDLDCWCVLDGEGRLKLDHKTHALRAGTCFLLAPGSRPTATHHPSRPLTVFAVHFAVKAPINLPPCNQPVLVTDTQRLRRLTELLADSAPLDSDFKRDEAALVLRPLLHLLSHPKARRAPADPRLEQARQQMRQRLAHSWTVEEMARTASLSPSRFNVLFKKQFGQSPLNYLIQARIDRARTLLRETRMSQAEIADALGYRDVYFFNRQFKKGTGIPPGRIRGRSPG